MGIRSEDVRRCLSNSPQLTFEITDACNLRCEYCGYGKFYSDYDERKSTRLSPLRAKVLLGDLSSLWGAEPNASHNQNVYISFYGGEPLMNVPFIKEIISYVEELDCPSRSFTFDMVINGILLDHRRMRSITEALNSDSSGRIQRLTIKS